MKLNTQNSINRSPHERLQFLSSRTPSLTREFFYHVKKIVIGEDKPKTGKVTPSDPKAEAFAWMLGGVGMVHAAAELGKDLSIEGTERLTVAAQTFIDAFRRKEIGQHVAEMGLTTHISGGTGLTEIATPEIEMLDGAVNEVMTIVRSTEGESGQLPITHQAADRIAA